MSNRQISKTTANLMRAKAVIENPANWCQGTVVDEKGRVCALGALYYKVHDYPNTEWPQIEDDLKYLRVAATQEAQSRPHYTRVPLGSPACVNDQMGHEAVIRMYDKAITLSMQQEAEE